MISVTYDSRKRRLILAPDSRPVVAWSAVGTGRGKGERLQRGTGRLLGVMDVFIILIAVMVSQAYAYRKHQTADFQ